MKNWKKNIGFAVVLVLLAGFASSCANDSGKSDDKTTTGGEVTTTTTDTSTFLGTWKLTKMLQNGTEVPAADLPIMTVTFTATAYVQITKGKYAASETKLTLRPTGDDPNTMRYTMPNATTYVATLEGSDGTTLVMIFKRQ